MTDEPPFTFRQAKTATQQPQKEEAAHAPPANTQPPAPPGASKRRRRVVEASPFKIDISVAIDAAAALAPADAQAFAALIKIINAQPMAGRRRLVKALARIFN